MRMIVRQAMYVRDEGRSLAAGLRRQAANHRERLRLRAVVVRVTGKARLDLVRASTIIEAFLSRLIEGLRLCAIARRKYRCLFSVPRCVASVAHRFHSG